MGIIESESAKIVALRNEKGSYNNNLKALRQQHIVALRNEKESYNVWRIDMQLKTIVALRNEKEAIQIKKHHLNR